MQYQVIGTGMLARAFASNAEIAHGGNAGIGPGAIICAAGVADSQSSDESAFQRVRELLGVLIHRARASDVTLVYFSGAPVYGRVVGLCLETTQVVPETAYGRHKLAWERLLTESGVRYLVLRLPNIVGAAGNPNQLIPSLVAQVARGLVVVRAGATRDLLDVDDLVVIVKELLRCRKTDLVLNVASGVSTPVLRLAGEVAAILGLSPSIVSVEGGDRQEFSTEMIRHLLPDYPRFQDEYPARVLIRRVPSILRSLGEGALL